MYAFVRQIRKVQSPLNLGNTDISLMQVAHAQEMEIALKVACLSNFM
jgi:hypothetical protein